MGLEVKFECKFLWSWVNVKFCCSKKGIILINFWEIFCGWKLDFGFVFKVNLWWCW